MTAYDDAMNKVKPAEPHTDMAGDNPPKAWTAQQAVLDLQAKAKANAASLERLGADGPDMGTMLKIRLDFLTDMMLNGDTEAQIRFAAAWEDHLGSILEMAEGHVNKSKIVVPEGVMPGQLVIPGS